MTQENRGAPDRNDVTVSGEDAATGNTSFAALIAEWEATAGTVAESEWDEGFRDGHAECGRQLRELLARRY